jgi:hypothetical protein
MRYSIFVSTEYGAHETFYCDTKDQANLLYNMAVECKFFDYVCLSKVYDESIMERDWASNE